jgi:8-oxo-dGTP pyrophosphatase MutT (NUDIX family)
MGSQQGSRRVGPYDVLFSRPVYENPWIKVREDRTLGPTRQEVTFGVVSMKPGVTVLPLDEGGEVHLVREFKYGIGEETLEAVSGAIESGETPERAGLRELGEEVGLIASEWIDMGVLNPFTTVIHSPNHMFLARDLSPMRRPAEQQEGIEIVKMPFTEALQSVLDGIITHGASCVVILKTHLYLNRQLRGSRRTAG